MADAPSYGIGTRCRHAGQQAESVRRPPGGFRSHATTSYVFHDTDHGPNLFGLR
jgi:O-acetylhomoserine/O-acetylserine sulfhydrylase-like pyridoxal-dependent enzyme